MKTKDKIIICVFAIGIVWLLILMIFAVTQSVADTGKVIFVDEVTGTQYIEKNKYIEVKGKDGYLSIIGTSGELEY